MFRVLSGHEAMITALAFTPDCAFLLSCSTAGDILLWDARYGHGKCLSSVTDAHDLGVLCCDFSSQYDAVGMVFLLLLFFFSFNYVYKIFSLSWTVK